MDWNHIKTLLDVIHAASGAGPKYAKIVAEADAELWAHYNAPPAEEPDEEEAA